MTPIVREWVEKGEADFATAKRELRARSNPNYDGACYHAQQCAEKYLKALLQKANIPFPRTHNLAVLLDSVLPLDSTWELMRRELSRLTGFAVTFRYPGASADRTTAREALVLCKAVRAKARTQMRLPE